MQSVALITFISSCIVFVVGLYVYYLTPKEQINRLFFFFSMILSLIGFIDFNYLISHTEQEASILLKIGSIWITIPVFLMHFVIIYTKNSNFFRSPFYYLFFHLPTVMFLLYDVITSNISGHPIRLYYGWAKKVDTNNYIWIIWSYITLITVTFLLLRHFQKQKDNLIKQQVFTVSMGVVLGISVVIFNKSINKFSDTTLPDMTILSGLIFITILCFGIYKYKLFQINTINAAPNILNTIKNFVFLTDRYGEIVEVNSFTRKQLHNSSNVIGQKIDNVLSKVMDGNKTILELVNNDLKKENILHNLTYSIKSSDSVIKILDVTVSTKKNQSGDILAIIINGKEITDYYNEQKELLRLNDNLEKLNAKMVERELKMIEIKNKLRLNNK